MEILILIALGAVAVFWLVNKMNKDSYGGSHPLDSITKEPVINNKTGDVVELAPVSVEQVAVLAVNDQITDSVTQEAPAKKPRKPRTPKIEKVVKEKAAKPVKAAAKPVAKKALAKRLKKA